ncbi:MAG: hypothetical protein LBO67_00470 [Spirochaetaceae bacterium]|nr:hypothetical protein [Spirochaetaceae bacterium]
MLYHSLLILAHNRLVQMSRLNEPFILFIHGIPSCIEKTRSLFLNGLYSVQTRYRGDASCTPLYLKPFMLLGSAQRAYRNVLKRRGNKVR